MRVTVADGAAISSSSCLTMTAGGIGSGRVNTSSSESTDCPTVNLAPADRRPGMTAAVVCAIVISFVIAAIVGVFARVF